MKNFTYNKKVALLTLGMMAAAVLALRSHAAGVSPGAECRVVSAANHVNPSLGLTCR